MVSDGPLYCQQGANSDIMYCTVCMYECYVSERMDHSCLNVVRYFLRLTLDNFEGCGIITKLPSWNILVLLTYFPPEGNPSGLNSKPFHYSFAMGLPKNPNYKRQTAYIRYLNIWLSRNTLTIWKELWFVGGPREGGTIWR